MADVWGVKRDIHTLTSTHNPPAEGNLCDENGNVIGSHIVEDYNLHKFFVKKVFTMANSYSIRYLTWKCTKKLFFNLLSTAIQKLYSFFMWWKANLIEKIGDLPQWGIYWQAHAGQQPHAQKPLGRPANVVIKGTRLESSSTNHWTVPFNWLQCCMCSTYGVTRKVSVKYQNVRWIYVWTKTVSWIIISWWSCKTASSATSLYKLETTKWNKLEI
jgi:hypothetical protein